MKSGLFSGFLCVVMLLASKAEAQVTHPLLIAALDSAERVPHGAYRIRAYEKYGFSKDTTFYRGQVAFARFEHFDGRPGLRYEADLETQYPSGQQTLRVVFDGRYKYVLYGDSLAQRYDLQRLDPDQHQFSIGYVFFFVPILLHEPTIRKYYGMRQDFGVPPYRTLGDTLIQKAPCTLVGAQWAKTDTTSVTTHYKVLFGLEKRTGLPIYFRYRTWEVRKREPYEQQIAAEEAPSGAAHGFGDNDDVLRGYVLEILVDSYTPALPRNSFYMDWQGLPKSYEVREFFDCYNREVIRPRLFEGL